MASNIDLVFIVPLKSPKVSSSWKKTSKLCNNTLKSILGQNTNNYKIVLVCNETPKNCVESKKIEIVKRELPVPSSESEMYEDIKRKIKLGMVRAKKFAPCYIMRVDSDDFVSDRISSFVKKKKDRDGWYISSGYVWSSGKKYIIKKERFSAYCGTSNIIWVEEREFPSSGTDENYIKEIWQHQNNKKKMKKYDKNISRLPFRGSTYHVDTSQNFYAASSMGNISIRDIKEPKKLIWKMLGVRPLTKSIIKEFGIRNVEND